MPRSRRSLALYSVAFIAIVIFVLSAPVARLSVPSRENGRTGYASQPHERGAAIPQGATLLADEARAENSRAAHVNKVGATETKATAAYGKLPLTFEANQGQSDARVKFVSRNAGSQLLLTANGAVLAINGKAHSKPEDKTSAAHASAVSKETADAPPAVLGMNLVAANPDAQVTGQNETPGKANYFLGNEPAKWRTNIPTYAKVRYESVYPGVDLIYYGNQHQLEYDFAVAPGADPKQIKLDFKGARKISLNKQGDLVLQMKDAEVCLRKPFVYQTVDGNKRQVASRYVLTGKHLVGFRVGAYDATRSLVIDPVLVYSTYLGGSGGDYGSGIVVDASGNAYIAGYTNSANFPLANPQQTKTAPFDAFVTKLNAAGTALVYSTYIGGDNADIARAIALDNSGNVYVTGDTTSSNFPTVNALQGTRGGGSGDSDAFVTKLNAAGSMLVYSTYIGGSSYERGYGIAADASGDAYVTGYSNSFDFPVTNNALQTSRRGNALFKSVSGGASWNAADAGLKSASVNGLNVLPTNPATVYAATDDGVFKSVDGGASWAAIGKNQTATPVNHLAIDPVNNSIIYAATDGGIYKSTDGGASWSLRNSNFYGAYIQTIVIDPVNPQNVYAGLIYGGGGIYKSTDGGNTWTVSLNDNGNSISVSALAIDPNAPSTIYAATFGGVYKSTNGGSTWSAINKGFIYGLDVYDLAIDRTNSSVIYAGTERGVYKSINGGSSWSETNTDFTFVINVLTIDPASTGTLYAGTYSGGVYKSIDGGNTWSASNTGIANKIIKSLVIDPANTTTVYAGTVRGLEAFVAKLNPAGTSLLYSTYLGGDEDDIAYGIAVNASGNAYVTGITYSNNFPLANPLQAKDKSEAGDDAFVAKLDPNGSALAYSTYLGGSLHDVGRAIAVDTGGNAYVTGMTASSNFPTANPMQMQMAGTELNYDAFVTKLNSNGSSLVYSTYLGGSSEDQGYGIAVDASGNAYVTGHTYSFDFPTTNPVQANANSYLDAFVTKLNPAGSAALYSTYLGGASSDYGRAVAVDAKGNAYVTGYTSSTNFPTANALQSSRGGGTDVFVAKLGQPTDYPVVEFTASNYQVGEGDTSARITVRRVGDASGAATVEYAASDGTANQRKDYTLASGTLAFAPGETVKTFSVLITDNAYVDGNRTVNLSLANPIGAVLMSGTNKTAVLTIADNDTATSSVNPIDEAQFFVRQHYYDFLNREPDTGGLNYWTNLITSCNGNAACINSKRVTVSAAFFIEQEFQDTGSFVYRFYKASYGQRPAYAQFILDRSRVVGGANLEAGKQSFAESWVQRPEFLQKYPPSLMGAAFIDAMLQTVRQGSGVDLSSQRNALIADDAANHNRARIVRQIVENQAFQQAEYNRAFVLMQYFGYLRRDPDQGGYDFWLDIVNNRVANNYRSMVCAFTSSAEYQDRFSSVRTRNDSICGQLAP